MQEQDVAHPLQGRESFKPVNMSRFKTCKFLAVATPTDPHRLSTDARTRELLAKFVGTQQHELMITEYGVNITTCSSRLYLQLHGQFNALNSLVTTIKKIAYQPQLMCTADPLIRTITE